MTSVVFDNGLIELDVGERRFWRHLRRKKFGDQSAARSGASCITLLASLLVLAAQRTLCVNRRS